MSDTDAPRDVRPGIDYSEELQAAIEGCAAFVVLVTDMANKSPYVRAETEMAFSCHKPIFPVRLRRTSSRPPASPCSSRSATGPTPIGAHRDAAMERLALELQTEWRGLGAGAGCRPASHRPRHAAAAGAGAAAQPPPAAGAPLRPTPAAGAADAAAARRRSGWRPRSGPMPITI